MLYIYAVAEGVDDIADLTGVQGEPLSLVTVGDARLVVGEVEARPALDAEVLRAQDVLVRALHERAKALLPMRFATTSATRDDMLRAVDAHHDLPERLARVRGCEQMVVRVFGAIEEGAETHAATGNSGADYLRARAKRLQPPALLDAIAAVPGGAAKATRIDVATQPGVVGAVYHLIARNGAAQYRDAIVRATRDWATVRVTISGPSPAYAFA